MRQNSSMTVICLLMSLAGASAVAAGVSAAPEVTLTSFSMAGSSTNAAEICGKVTGVTSPALVHITVDDGSKHPGNYSVLVDSDGPFCTSVVTYRRSAVASVSNLGSHSRLATVVSIRATENP